MTLTARSLYPVYFCSLVVPIDEAVVLPSLFDYIRSLGGDAQSYGNIQVAFYVCRIIAMPVVGLLVGRLRSGLLLTILLTVGTLASLLYTFAPILGGVSMVLISRAMLGLASSASVAILSYVAEQVPREEQTKAYSINFALERAGVPLAPALTVLFVHLPVIETSWITLDKYTYAGVMMFILNLALLLNMQLLIEPPLRRHQSGSTPGPREVCRTLGSTGAYFSYVMSFQNNWNSHTIMWTIPILTSRLYPEIGVVGNSLLFASGGITAIIVGCLTPKVFRGWAHRSVLLVTQGSAVFVLLPFALVYGCHAFPGETPLWVLVLLHNAFFIPHMAQMPSNNAIYAQLVGTRGRGIYFSLLEMSKTLARIIAGYLIGLAYTSLGSCPLWSISLGVWAIQFVPFLANWRRLDVERQHAAREAKRKVMEESGNDDEKDDVITSESETSACTTPTQQKSSEATTV
mmetsp:Transcript_43361/g.92836  ORF Transcript_43361/g.92836 Transcript_43361/m.92836 type:complete len:460 (-) Transcript_43361:213-1592(-)|eukprot:CAMPEP_0206453182 /NCGR_PEP_ID=MMETSP0324_2-20121206/20386_1 /ASSEMBLY_ACC=CAM_ASM_000836 /TAXON_ID=2866 /ORGANISM="Crypthecodinium cohnii, Strain Seligo" /LENGTH=459 /DNA_ID=CAMNT_0053923409 /DNA_START=29 /DNA_END=1408 /DNA_ORIENTATION=+